MNLLHRYPVKKYYLLLLSPLVLFSCKERPGARNEEGRQSRVQQLNEAEEYAKTLPGDERTVYWKKLLQESSFSKDSALKARICYRLAGTFYYKGDLDSIKWYMRKAWGLMEGQSRHHETIVLLNYGEGNIATIEGNLHQENYYFNQAAQGIVSDSLIKLTPVQKASIFMATAQSDARLSQYRQAANWNRRSIEILDSAAVSPRLMYRAYRQLATNFRNATDRNADSVYRYIKKMEALVNKYPSEINPRFLYDEKAHYYDRTGHPDSAVAYHKKILNIDKRMISSKTSHPTYYTNLFRDYINLSHSYNHLKLLDSACYYMERGTAFMEAHGEHLTGADQVLYQESLVDYLFLTEQYSKAYEEYKTLLTKSKALHENEYAQSIAEMSTIYKLQVNERQILELGKQVIIAKSRLSENRLLLIITALSALLAIAIVVLLYVGRKQLKLKEQKERVQLQKNAMELEQRLLRTQMEPHFIFNTLSALQSFIRLEQKEKALRYLKQFSGLLRHSLELSRDYLVPLDDEIATLEYYLSLQQMRYEEHFNYQVQHPEMDDACQILIPPMLIQPFVENAIIHGVANMEKKGDITVSLRLKDETLYVRITDNGPGINTRKGQADRKKKSLSTTISRERLEILAQQKGVKVEIHIKDRQDLPGGQTGTLVALTIPVEKDF